jgi:predicted DCC family thiol-disulfide oxidoreductase YuxK
VPCAIQSARGQALLHDLTPDERLASAHVVSPDGERFSGGAAAAPLFRLLPGGAMPAGAMARLPRLTSRAYGWVATHRSQLSRAVPGRSKRRAGARVKRAEADAG